MNENNNSVKENLHSESVVSDEAPDYKTIGAKLRALRESKNISYSDVINRIKIPQKFLKAIEDGDWSVISNVIYIRAFVRDYAKYLNYDIDDELNLVVPVKTSKGAVASSSVVIPKSESYTVKPKKSKLNWILVLILFSIAGLIVYFGLSNYFDKKIFQHISDIGKSGVVVSKPLIQITPSVDSQSQIQAIPSISSVIMSQDLVENPKVEDENTAGNIENLLTISTNKNSWIRVSTKEGVIISEKMATPNAAFSQIIKPPFSLVIGDAINAKAIYNGKELEINKSLTPNGNARLYVN